MTSQFSLLIFPTSILACKHQLILDTQTKDSIMAWGQDIIPGVSQQLLSRFDNYFPMNFDFCVSKMGRSTKAKKTGISYKNVQKIHQIEEVIDS